MLASQNHKPIYSYIIAGGDKWVNTGYSTDILVDARKYHCSISAIVTCFILKSPVDVTGNSRGWLFAGSSLTRQGENLRKVSNIKQAFASFCRTSSSCHSIRPKHWTRKCYSSLYYIHLKKHVFVFFVLFGWTGVCWKEACPLHWNILWIVCMNSLLVSFVCSVYLNYSLLAHALMTTLMWNFLFLKAPFVAGQLDFCLRNLEIFIPVLIGFNPIDMAR